MYQQIKKNNNNIEMFITFKNLIYKEAIDPVIFLRISLLICEPHLQTMLQCL